MFSPPRVGHTASRMMMALRRVQAVRPFRRALCVGSDIEVAQKATMLKIGSIASGLGIPDDALEPYGHYKAKVSLKYIDTLADKVPSDPPIPGTGLSRRRLCGVAAPW